MSGTRSNPPIRWIPGAGWAGYLYGRTVSDDKPDEGSAVIELPQSSRAASIAREFIRAHRSELSPETLSDAELMVSELVTNAVLHGAPKITLRVRRHPPSIAVDVTDAGELQPTLPNQPPDPDAPGGRGLLIVEALSTSWGVTPAQPPPGKTIWFEI